MTNGEGEARQENTDAAVMYKGTAIPHGQSGQCTAEASSATDEGDAEEEVGPNVGWSFPIMKEACLRVERRPRK